MKINFNFSTIKQNFNAKLSPDFRDKVALYRLKLKESKDFVELKRLKKNMVKIKFLCPGKIISNQYLLDNDISLISSYQKDFSAQNNFNNEIIERIISKLSLLH